MDNVSLKEGIKHGKVICFADEILVTSYNLQEAREHLRANDSLSTAGLCLNNSKAKITGDHSELRGVVDIEGVKVGHVMQFLGMDIVCDRQLHVKKAKLKFMRFMANVRVKSKRKTRCSIN